MSTHLRQVTQTVRSLQSADKYVFLGAVVLIVGLFLPWFSVNMSDLFTDASQVTNAFTGTTYIVGYLCYFFALIALNTIDKKLTIAVAIVAFALFLLNFSFNSSQAGITLFAVFAFLLCNIALIFALDNLKFLKRIPKNTVNLFVGLENVILVFVASMIYHKQSLGYTSANLSFGVYIGLLGAIVILYGGYLQMKLYKKATIKEVFTPAGEALHGGIHLRPDLSIDKTSENQNNEPAKKENSQLSFGDYE